jgi:hypothetical protein
MENAAVNRLAKSITQLTLCQVTTDEVDAATKLLDKACQKLRDPWSPQEFVETALAAKHPGFSSDQLPEAMLEAVNFCTSHSRGLCCCIKNGNAESHAR